MAGGVYIHIPFCKSRCSYCDFATDVYRSSGAVERYVAAVCSEILVFPDLGIDADTIYFGGGTPSLLAPGQVGQILAAVLETFNIDTHAEVTMEMNPATVSPQSLAGYRDAGVNRASFGVQTFDDRALKLLARGHDASDVRKTFGLLKRAGFDNISFDLIAGLPGQTMDRWSRDLDEAIGLAPEHMSLYLLEIHDGTPLAEQVRSGRRPVPDDDLAAEMYILMLDRLADAGYSQYEISNFCRPGRESRHNNKYWRLDPVFGFGVSAHSFNGRQRYSNERDTAKYVEAMITAGSAEATRETVDVSSEFIFLGLRLNQGIDLAEYRARFGKVLVSEYPASIGRLVTDGLIVVTPKRISLTPRGRLFSNEVFAEFV